MAAVRLSMADLSAFAASPTALMLGSPASSTTGAPASPAAVAAAACDGSTARMLANCCSNVPANENLAVIEIDEHWSQQGYARSCPLSFPKCKKERHLHGKILGDVPPPKPEMMLLLDGTSVSMITITGTRSHSGIRCMCGRRETITCHKTRGFPGNTHRG
jgi:hypothetical protein